MPRLPAFAAALSLCAATAAGAQDVAPAPAQPPITVRDIRITGTKELSESTVRRAIPVEAGQAWFGSTADIERAVVRRYEEDGYTFARATATLDVSTGALSVTIDEGIIDDIEFQGVGATVAAKLAEEFALRAGDVFNRPRAMQALTSMLRRTRGAIRPSRAHFRDTTSQYERRGTFDLVDRNGRRVLIVGLRQPKGQFRLSPGFGGREDWFTPVDGFVPSLGFGAAVFDHDNFNHAYVAGHVSIRTAQTRVGYALGFERPLFQARPLYVGGELHDLTATDDRWQVSETEASLAAVGPRKSFRDYYRRRGLQITAAWRVHPQAEFLLAWRGERQEPLQVETEFSLWNGDEPFRPNVLARDGRLNAIVVGASVDAVGFDRESLQSTYLRHQLESAFGERLPDRDGRRDLRAVWRIDWTSEISTPDALASDFDFKRHIVSARTRVVLSPHQDFGARAVGGWSQGALPPQRQFAAGGIGSVHGYAFKESIGDSLALLNLEYGLGWRRGVQVLGFFDVGRAAPRNTAGTPWLKGVGFGVGLAGARLEFGYKLNDIPSSLQVLLRFGRTF
jgi:hypothetical protein